MMRQLTTPVAITPEITDAGRQSLEHWLKNLVITASHYKLKEIIGIIDNASIWPSEVREYGNIQHYLSTLRSKYDTRIKIIKDHNTISKCIWLGTLDPMHEILILEREIDMENESKTYVYPMAQIEIRARNEHDGNEVTVLRRHIQKYNKEIELRLDTTRNCTCCGCLYQEEEFFDFHPNESSIHVKDFYVKSDINNTDKTSDLSLIETFF